MPKRTRTVSTFTVRGFGEFPFDMLRYDGCYPATSADASKLEAAALDRTTPQRVVMAADHVNVTWVPCVARWASFNCRVLPATEMDR